LEVALARNATRTNKEFDTEFLPESLKAIYQSFDDQIHASKGWTIINSTHQNISAMVDEIYQRTKMVQQ
jgi:hypothetical protein